MNDVPADGQTLGEVIMRGNNTMKGYYADPEAMNKPVAKPGAPGAPGAPAANPAAPPAAAAN